MGIQVNTNELLEPAAALLQSSAESNIARLQLSGQESHFRTDHLQSNLRGRAISGGFVTAGAQIARFGLYFASTIILARLLSPQEFGLVAMVGTLIALLRMFREAGLSTATVQKSNITHTQVSNLFWINIALGGISAIVAAALSPAVAWFYRDPRLVNITLVLSITFVVSGAAVQHLALLNRQMRFKAMALIDIGSMAGSLLVGVVMACLGCGYWSLVGSQLSMAITELLLALYASRWRPQWPRRRNGTRSLLSFGASLTASNLMRRIAQGSDTLLIGRFYGADAVGLYSRAAALLMRPLDQFITPFDAVFVPVLSMLQDQPERYRRAFLQAYGAIALLSFPLAGLFQALANPLVLLLLGARWGKVIPIFSWLSLAALFIPLSYAAMWLLTTQGRSRDMMTTGVLFSATTVIFFAAGLPFGPVGVAAAFSLSGLLIRLPIQYYVVGRSGPVTTKDLWIVFFKHLPAWVAVSGAAYFMRMMVLDFSPIAQLCICTPVGLIAGLIVICLIPSQRREALYLFDVLARVIRPSAPVAQEIRS